MGDRELDVEATWSPGIRRVASSFRQWLATRLIGSAEATPEPLLEQFFQVARDIESNPQQGLDVVARFLAQICRPAAFVWVPNGAVRSQVLRGGMDLLVPLSPLAQGVGLARNESLLLSGAEQGHRRFSSADALLADSIVEHVRRSLAFDQAVERGRNEERLRLAQDLHDDIGARLLTLMYTAPSPEMEDYLRLTLQDLKTLTRGLAVSNQLLSHAVAEWKADASQRLNQARVDLRWSAEYDIDVPLGVVQWSAITRILRELITNAIAHAQARKVEVRLVLNADQLEVTVLDDGAGKEPTHWSPGLGTGGVRKRVRQLGGGVQWTERPEGGIECRVTVDRLSASALDRRT
jgi:signal transduction histidine kinase